MNVKEVLENDPGAYFIQEELLAPLKVMYNSLQETGDDSIANGRLLDCMRQVCPHNTPSPSVSPSPTLAPCPNPCALFIRCKCLLSCVSSLCNIVLDMHCNLY